MAYVYDVTNTNTNHIFNNLMRVAAATIRSSGYFSDVVHDVAFIMHELGPEHMCRTAATAENLLQYAWVVSENGTHLISKSREGWHDQVRYCLRQNSTSKLFTITAAYQYFGSIQIQVEPVIGEY